MLRERVAPKSEVIRVICLEDSPCCAAGGRTGGGGTTSTRHYHSAAPPSTFWQVFQYEWRGGVSRMMGGPAVAAGHDLDPALGVLQISRRRDCHFDDTPGLSLLKHLLNIQGGAIK